MNTATAKQSEQKVETKNVMPSPVKVVTPKVVAEISKVTMSDGIEVSFAGKRQIQKTVILNKEAGTVSVRFDFRNGETRTVMARKDMMLDYAGHGLSQKVGDEAAGEKDIDDAIVAIDNIISRLAKGDWRAAREAGGGGFSGASIVIRAIMEVNGKTQEFIKDFLDKKLESTPGLTRQALYASFRNPSSKVGAVIARMEREKLVKTAAFDADKVMAEMI